MKKYLMFLVLFAAVTIILPAKTFAQYYNTYRNGAILNHALASQRAAALRAKGRQNKRVANPVRRNAHKNRVQRKARRVSTLENMIEPKFRINFNLPNKSLIV